MDFPLPEDTICAVATPVGEGGIGIIRISGPEAPAVAGRLFRPRKKGVFPLKSHRLYLGWIHDPDDGQPVDEVLLSCMAAPHTYTREDIVEINCHSGYAVLNRILEIVLKSGIRLAEPGEFTRRAFLNGRIDLSQAEAVIDIIRSRSHQSLLIANRHMQGAVREMVEQWRGHLLDIRSNVEAAIDFSEDLDHQEGDIPSQADFLCTRLRSELLSPIEQTIRHYCAGRILREGLTIVLAGKPNVGKSSLLNALLGKDRAIVTPFPGTTRDVVEDSFILSGVQVRILDTAGIRHEPDEIESFGIERTLHSVSQADVVIWVIDGSRPITSEDDSVFHAVSRRELLVVLNKSDLPCHVSELDAKQRFGLPSAPVRLSALNSTDMEKLRTLLAERYLRQPIEQSEGTIVLNLRHKGCLEDALQSLYGAEELLRGGAYGELVSFELAQASKKLDSILGWDGDSELLDRIFSRFCIGK